jgi:soluble lytic murein transglycosylase-like protein
MEGDAHTEGEPDSPAAAATRADRSGGGPPFAAEARPARPARGSVHRRRIARAIVGALLLVGWNNGPEVASVDASEPTPEVAAAPTLSLDRDGIVTTLRRRNPQLGATQATRIADAVLACTETQQIEDLTPELVLSIMFQESDARPHAVSPKGAVGLMQVMPYMYRVLQLPGGIANLESNIEAGCLLLADNMRRLGRERGILSYFWGSQIRGDEYLRGVERILKGISAAAPDHGPRATSEPG